MITIEEQPYAWAARGQKLIYRASSDETAQSGFKYIVRVTDVSNTRNYEFLYDPTPFDGKLYFDLNPLVYLRNWENDSGGKYIIPHYSPWDTPTEEPETYGYSRYDVEIGEGWVIDGIFTENVEGAAEAEMVYIFNAYLQPFYGYRPDPNLDANLAAVYALYSNETYAWSDRFIGTHNFYFVDTFSAYLSLDSVFIPTYDSDWGAIAAPVYTDGPLTSNDVRKIRIELYYDGATSTVTDTLTLVPTSATVYPFLHLGCYPQNLKIGGSSPDPTAYDWDFYRIYFLTNGDDPASVPYVFYNAAKYGQHDCKNDIIRIAWVSMRGGWDYFNFIKRSEITNQVDRKQFTRRLNNNTSGIFYPNQRQTIDTLNLNERILTVNSDWIQENEFVYLKNLFNSNQVQWLTKTTLYPLRNNAGQEPEQAVPVSLVDTTFIEQRGRNGKKVNVTLKFKVTQDFWT